jgi:hypothetical protein
MYSKQIPFFIKKSFFTRTEIKQRENKAKIHSHFTGVKASYGMGLKSAQAWGCPMPMLHKMSIEIHKTIREGEL